jgi:hypothetical protein
MKFLLDNGLQLPPQGSLINARELFRIESQIAVLVIFVFVMKPQFFGLQARRR